MTKEAELTSDERVRFLDFASSILRDSRNGNKPSRKTITLLKGIDEDLLVKVYKEFKSMALRKGISIEFIIDFSKHWSEEYERLPILPTERMYSLDVEDLEIDRQGQMIIPSSTHHLIRDTLTILELRNYVFFPDMYSKTFERLY